MNKKHTIKGAFTQLLVTVVLVISAIYSLLLLGYSWMIEDNIFNRQVLDEARFIQHYFKTNQTLPPLRSRYMSLHSDWQGLPPKIKLEHQRKPSKVEFTTNDGRTIHIHKFKLNNKPYILAADVASFEVSRDYLPSMLWTLVILSTTFCLIVALLALHRAKRITLPLERLARQVAEEKAITDIQISGDYPNNEIGLLANRIKESFSRLTDAWLRESNFTKDISHEIRTPVAIANNILALPSHQLDDTKWQKLRDTNLQLAQITETLLALARNESTEVENTNLSILIEQCLLSNPDINYSEKGQALEFNLNNQEDVYLTINQQLITILINNILSNIVHYTSGQRIDIELTQSVLSFSNSFIQPPPAGVFNSGTRGQSSDGIGHGLSLIKRIADVYQWHVTVNTTQSKFTLSISFNSKHKSI